MKKHITLALRVVVSVGILAYLMNNICNDVARGVAAKILRAPAETWQQTARELGVDEPTAQMIREKCEFNEATGTDLAELPRADRLRFAWSVGPHQVGKTFGQVNLLWFAAALGCFGMVCLVGTLRWRLIMSLQGLEIPIWRALSIFFIGHFFNAFMLGATGGDVVKALYAAHETHHKKAEAVATVIMDRIIGLMALFVFALAMMSFFWQRVFVDPRMVSFAVFVLAVLMGTIGLTVLGVWGGEAGRFPRLWKQLERLPKFDVIRRMMDAYRAFARHPGAIGKTLVLSFGVHVCVMFSIVCIARGLSIHTTHGLSDFFLYLPIINTVAAMPVSISGFGVREWMYVAMLSGVGVGKEEALALSLLGYVATLMWSLVGGVFFLTHRRELPAAENVKSMP
jgi:uncharacterized protein (TIRG00374 family)